VRRLGGLLRRVADRADSAGALRRTPWSFTIEESLGAVFNEEDLGCPVWACGDDYSRASAEKRFPKGLDSVEWVTIGVRTEPGRVMVLGSADVPVHQFSRQARGHARYGTGRIPRWAILLNCEMRTFVQSFGPDYPSALKDMFGRGGRPG